VEPILDTLVERLGMDDEDAEGEGKAAGEQSAQAGDIDLDFDPIHNVIAQVVTLVPTAARTLLGALVKHFPHKRHRVAMQRVYLMNMLRAMVYVPAIRAPALAAIVERLVSIDVEIKIDEAEEEEEELEDNWSEDSGMEEDAGERC